MTTMPFSLAIFPSVSVVGPGTASARSKSAWSSRWPMYCVRNSSGRHTSVAPCCAASRMRATAFPRFAWGSSLIHICTSPILNLSGIPFMPNNNSESLARRQDDRQPGHVFSFSRACCRRRVAVEPALRVCPHDGGSQRDGAKRACEADFVVSVGEGGVASHVLVAVVQRQGHADDDSKRRGDVEIARSLRATSSETIGRGRSAAGADPAIAADRARFHPKQVRQGVRVFRGELIVSHAGVDFRRVIAITWVDVVARSGIPVILHAEIHPDLGDRPAVPAIQIQLERSAIQKLISAHVRAPSAHVRAPPAPPGGCCVVDAPLNRGLRVGLGQPSKPVIAHERHVARERMRRLGHSDGQCNELRPHHTLGPGTGFGSRTKDSTTTLPPSELPLPAKPPRSFPKYASSPCWLRSSPALSSGTSARAPIVASTSFRIPSVPMAADSTVARTAR